MSVLRHEDFDETDRDLTLLAGAWLLATAHDLVFKHNAGDRWAFFKGEDAAEGAREARELIDAMDKAVRESRGLLDDAERSARRRAVQRQRGRRQRAAAERPSPEREEPER